MSKIFEALQKARDVLPQGLPPVLTHQLSASIDDASGIEETAPEELEEELPQTSAKENSIRIVSIDSAAPVFPFSQSRTTAAEQYRMIRTRIVQNVEPGKLIVVSSAESGDGKTLSAINIGGALALKSDINVLILDADLYRPAVAKTLGIPARPGLTEVLRGTVPLRDAIVRTELYPNLYILPAGEVVTNRSELLDSALWRKVCETARSRFHYTIVDAPPIDAVADYPLIQAAGDYVVVIIRPDHTNRVRCMHALQSVPSDKLIGTVINAMPDWFMLRNSNYHYYGYYGYYKQDSEKKAKD